VLLGRGGGGCSLDDRAPTNNVVSARSHTLLLEGRLRPLCLRSGGIAGFITPLLRQLNKRWLNLFSFRTAAVVVCVFFSTAATVAAVRWSTPPGSDLHHKQHTGGFLAAVPLLMAEAFAALVLQGSFRGDLPFHRESQTAEFGQGSHFRRFRSKIP